MREHGVDAVRRRNEFIKHAAQPPGRHFLLHLPGRAPRQPEAGDAPVVQHLPVAAVEPAARAQMHHRRADPECPAARLARIAAQREALVARQFVGVAGRAGALEVARRRHAKAPVVGQTHAHQAAVGQVADPHGAIDALVDDVDDPVAQVQRNLQVGVQLEEARHQRSDMAAPEAGRCRQPQVAAGAHATCTHARFSTGKIGQ